MQLLQDINWQKNCNRKKDVSANADKNPKCVNLKEIKKKRMERI